MYAMTARHRPQAPALGAHLVQAFVVLTALFALCVDATARPSMTAAVGIPASCADVRARADRETVLAHDDGTPETSTAGQAGMRVAVRYQAPTWAQAIAGIEIYIMDDNITNPNDPQAPTTEPFTIWIWRLSDTGLPGPAARLTGGSVRFLRTVQRAPEPGGIAAAGAAVRARRLQRLGQPGAAAGVGVRTDRAERV